jgi:hypothetical protein
MNRLKPDRVVTTTCLYGGVGCNLQLYIKDDFIFGVTSLLIRKTPQTTGYRTQAFEEGEGPWQI